MLKKNLVSVCIALSAFSLLLLFLCSFILLPFTTWSTSFAGDTLAGRVDLWVKFFSFLYPGAFKEYQDTLDYDNASFEDDHEDIIEESVDKPVRPEAEYEEDRFAGEEPGDLFIKYCPTGPLPTGAWPTGESRYAEGQMSD